MTIFDMLDRLEAGILSLLPQAHNPTGSPPKKRAAAPKKKKSLAIVPRRTLAEAESAAPSLFTAEPELAHEQVVADEQATPAGTPATPAADGKEAARVLGKRQALGRSLVQLRRMSPHRIDGGQGNAR